MSRTEFMNRSAVFISYEDVDDEEANRVTEELEEAMKNKGSWKQENDSLIPISGSYDPEDVIDDLKILLEILNKNNVPWEGGTVPFNIGDIFGFLRIKENEALIAYIDDNDELNKSYIPLIDSDK